MSKELTDAWKAGNIKSGWYWVKTAHGFIQPMYYLITRVKGELVKGFAEEPYDRIKEVLSPCNYNHFVELTEKVKELKRDIKVLTNNYKLLEKQQAENLAHGQALVDEFGDFEALYEEVVRLRKEVAKGDEIIGKLLNEGHAAIEKNKQLSCLLKECDSCVRTLRAFGVSDCNGSDLNNLLTRITTAIGKSED